jgi:hypothetical protein
MSGPDVPPDEMVNFPWPGERAGAMPTQDLQALLNGPSSSGEDDGWATLAGLLRAVAAPGRAEELAGLAAAVAVFRHERDGISPVHRRDEARRTTMLSTFMSSRTTVAAFAAAAVGVSATAAAACTGALPEPIKRTAYRILGASGLQQAQPVPDPLPTNSAGSAPARLHRAVGFDRLPPARPGGRRTREGHPLLRHGDGQARQARQADQGAAALPPE